MKKNQGGMTLEEKESYRMTSKNYMSKEKKKYESDKDAWSRAGKKVYMKSGASRRSCLVAKICGTGW